MTQKKTSSAKSKKGNKPALSSSTGSESAPAAAAPSAASQSAVSQASGTGNSGKAGWIAPAALLFGLIGTGWSAYLWSQLKNLGTQTAQQLQSQAESTKTATASVKTELDEKSAALSTALEQKSVELTSTLEEKTATLATALEEKTAALQQTIDERSDSLNAALQETTTSMNRALEETSGSMNSALASRSDELFAEVSSVSEALRAEAQANKSEIATTTATAIQEMTTRTETEINNASTSFNTGLAMQRQRANQRFEEIDERLTSLDESVRTTNELASRGQRDWVLAEVNYLLRTGVHRVSLAGDVKAGVIALESASDRLHALGDIDYMPVREQIQEEITALKQAGAPDIEGLIFELESLSKQADTLPLPPSEMEKARAQLKEDPAGATASIGRSLLDKLNFSMEVSEQAVEGGSSGRRGRPSREQLDASDNLRLHLQAARLSALRHDTDNFTSHIDNAIGFAVETFDQDSGAVTSFIADLTDIRETEIVPNVPALGSALDLFTRIDAKRDSQ